MGRYCGIPFIVFFSGKSRCVASSILQEVSLVRHGVGRCTARRALVESLHHH